MATSTVEVRRSVGADEGFCFDPTVSPWSGWDQASDQRLGATLDWPGITPPGHVRQDWGRPLEGRRLADRWVRRSIGSGLFATLSVRGMGPVPPTLHQRLFVWAMAGQHRLRPGAILEVQDGDEVTVFQPVTDTGEV